MLRLVDELEVGEGGCPLLEHPVVEAGPEIAVGPVVLGAELLPPARVVDRVAAERGREVGVLPFERVAAHDPHPGRAVGEEGREAAHVVLDDHVRLRAGQDLPELRLAELRSVDQRLPHRSDERVELLDRRLAELRRRLRDEVGPELPGVLVALGRWSQVHEVLFEAEGLETASPGGLRGEHHAMPTPLEDLADPDAVVRGPVRALGHEDDGERLGHDPMLPDLGPSCTSGRQPDGNACRGRPTLRVVRRRSDDPADRVASTAASVAPPHAAPRRFTGSSRRGGGCARARGPSVAPRAPCPRRAVHVGRRRSGGRLPPSRCG